jgi:hypothetical protein
LANASHLWARQPANCSKKSKGLRIGRPLTVVLGMFW